MHKGKTKMRNLVIFTFVTVVLAFGHQLSAQTGATTDTPEATQISQQVATPTTPEATQTSQQAATPATLAKAPLKKLGFRLTEWKTFHAHSTPQAEETVATLKKIGCEVTTANHGNHVDVKYRCAEWKSLKLATYQLVNQWSNWCESKGMETVVINPPATTKKATVKFRLLTPRTVHLHDPAEAQQILSTLDLIGCQVSTNNHGNHIDTTFSSPDWITLELGSDEKAHGWQEWLDASGFETQHKH